MWELDYKESWAPKGWCFWTVLLEKTLESPLDCKEIQLVHPKGDQSSVFIGRTDAKVETPNTLATWCKELTHLKSPWCWVRLKAGGEGDDRGWDGWMASLTRWTWVWASSGLQSMGSQRVRHYWMTELMSMESMMPSNHLILCYPLLLLSRIPPSIRVFSSESTLCMRWPKYWSFSFSISPSNKHPGLISFRMD